MLHQSCVSRKLCKEFTVKAAKIQCATLTRLHQLQVQNCLHLTTIVQQILHQTSRHGFSRRTILFTLSGHRSPWVLYCTRHGVMWIKLQTRKTYVSHIWLVIRNFAKLSCWHDLTCIYVVIWMYVSLNAWSANVWLSKLTHERRHYWKRWKKRPRQKHVSTAHAQLFSL